MNTFGAPHGESTAVRSEKPVMLELDGLRAVAVLSVAWSHWAPNELLFGLPWGTGVQLFFVLSGFLITGILLDNKPEGGSIAARHRVWRNFYLRRALRIFPLFYLVLLACWLFAVDSIESTWPWHAFYLSNLYYFLGNRPDAYLHLWSLSVEEQFYLVWPFLVLLLPTRQLQTALILAIVAAPIFKTVVMAFTQQELVRYLPIACLDSLGIGALLALTSRQQYPGWNASVLAKICLFVGLPVAIAVGTFEAIASEPYWLHAIGHTGLVLFFGWLVITAARGFGGPVGAVLQSKPMTYLGKISYGIYIYHFFAPRIVNALGIEASLPGGLGGRLAAYSAITLLIATVSWHAYEAPINRLKQWVPYH